jgi:hypothetical protein
MKGLIKLCALLFLGVNLLCMGVNHLHAQSKNNNPDMRWWLNGGWGRGSGGGLAAIGSFNLQYKQFLFSARIASNTTDYAFLIPIVALFPTETETFTDYGLLLGLATRKKWFDASIATGVALMSYRREVFGWLRHEIKKEVNDAQISLPVEAQAFFKPASFLGFGATLFGNINSEKSFGGLTFNLQLGKLR